MSGVHTGIDGFVQAHDDAVQTAGVIRERESPSNRPIAHYEQFELIALLSRDPDARNRFVQRLLGPLATDTKAADQARQTLRVFLACGSSPSRAAKRLGVHRNTISYRLNALENLIPSADTPDTDWTAQATRRLELELALRIVEQLGPLPSSTRT
jgi:DNA-binding PucR family transcriptional regulator